VCSYTPIFNPSVTKPKENHITTLCVINGIYKLLYSLPNIVVNVNKLVIDWPGMLHVCGSINAYTILVQTPERKRLLGRARRKWESNLQWLY
jgi:hypothetical protein